MDNCSASAVESKHLDVKSGAALTNGKEDWLIQLLLREKCSDDTRVMSGALGQTVHLNRGKKVREKNGEGKFEEPRVDAGP